MPYAHASVQTPAQRESVRAGSNSRLKHNGVHMETVPTSYKDPYWRDLAAVSEKQNGLPFGILQAIVVRGERSNHNETNKYGTFSPFQITSGTRKLAIKKWDVDPMLSPENAADVAGKLIKESLARNKGDPVEAVGEYIGGVKRVNWGSTTKAYIARVFKQPLEAAFGEFADKAPPPLAVDSPVLQKPIPQRQERVPDSINAKIEGAWYPPIQQQELLSTQMEGSQPKTPTPHEPPTLGPAPDYTGPTRLPIHKGDAIALAYNNGELDAESMRRVFIDNKQKRLTFSPNVTLDPNAKPFKTTQQPAKPQKDVEIPPVDNILQSKEESGVYPFVRDVGKGVLAGGYDAAVKPLLDIGANLVVNPLIHAGNAILPENYNTPDVEAPTIPELSPVAENTRGVTEFALPFLLGGAGIAGKFSRFKLPDISSLSNMDGFKEFQARVFKIKNQRDLDLFIKDLERSVPHLPPGLAHITEKMISRLKPLSKENLLTDTLKWLPNLKIW